MDIALFLKTHQDESYDEIKQIFENKYNIKVNLNINKDYFMLLCTKKSDLRKRIIRQCTGTIVDIKTKSILHYFGEKSYQNVLINESYFMDNFFIEPYIDGIIIKFFRHINKWKIATSNHTNIKMVKQNNNNLYNVLETVIKDIFGSMNLFLKGLNKDYCYSYLLYNNNNIKLINRVCLKTLSPEFNMKDSFPLINFIKIHNNDIKKYILTKIDENGTKRIHIDKIKLELLYNNIFYQNDKNSDTENQNFQDKENNYYKNIKKVGR